MLRLAAVSLVTVSLACASITSWFTRKQCDWDFVQKVGGVEVTAAQLENGRPAAKVRFNPSGTQAITCPPAMLNSALVFDQASVRVSGDEVRVKVYTARIEKGRAYADTMTVPLPRKAHGNYRLRYENPDRTFFEMGALIVP
ncbi:MAG TPA: hypothetical protein VK785_01130 [Opitutaceae bacterium]|jgi:hypothetical protein|nr:hypothetical protein [Opitutaceae bacterium]